MDQDHIKNELLIERYLQDQLSPGEEAAFEEAFLGSPDLLDELEAAEKLKQGLRDISVLEKSRAAEPRKSWVPSLFQSPQWAMAASFLLLVSFATTGVLYQRVGELEALGGTIVATGAQIVPLVTVRGTPGADPVNTIELGPDHGTFVLMLDPGFETYSYFRATLLPMGSVSAKDVVFQADRLTPGYEEMLALSVPASLLTPGDFEVRVEGWRQEWPPDHAFDSIGVMTLRVVSAD